jgi:amino acid adenylation domain-containing protein
MQKEITVGYRLSPRQKRLWELQQDDARQPYRVQCGILVEGDLDKLLLKSAIENVVGRFEILRTTFYTPPGVLLPVQVINGAPVWSIEEHDLSHLPGEEQQSELKSLAGAQRRVPFDLEREGSLHVALLTLSTDRHLLLVCLPALCADDTAPAHLLREIARSYSGLKGAQAPDDEPMQYADFSEWHGELLESDKSIAARLYWAQQVKPEFLDAHLPSEKHLRAQRTFNPDVESFKFTSKTLAKLDELAARNTTPLPDLLLACWQILLWRLTGQPELAVGHASSDRKYEELEGALGLFTGYMPARSRFAGGMKPAEAEELLSASVREGYKWQEYFDWSLLAEPLGDAANSSFLPFGFDFAIQPETRRAADLSWSLYQQYFCIERFTLRLSCLRAGGSLTLDLHYDRNRLGAGEAKRVLLQFEALLESILNNPDAPIEQLEIINAEEQRLLRFEFNNTAADFLSESCAHHLFEEQTKRTPGNTALRFASGTLTYQELNERANQLAHHLRARGVGPEALVAVCLERSPEMVVAVLAVLKAGGAYLPLDIASPPDRLRFMLDDSGALLVLTQEHLASTVTTGANEVITLDGEDTAWASLSSLNPSHLALPDNLAYAIYTSGSTGFPKAVLIPHRPLVNYLCWANSAYGPHLSQGAPLHSTLAFDLSVTSLWLPLLSGTTLTLLDENAGVEALVSALRLGDDYTLVKLTPAHLQVLAAQLKPAELARATRALIIGGEALMAETLQVWREHAPQTRLINEYGPTETVVGCCVYEVREGDATAGSVSIGRGISNTRLYVVDERLRMVGIGVVGELLVGGAGVGRGYHGRAEQTAAAYIPDYLSGESGGRLYRTGDLVRWSEAGELEYVGRRDEQVKVRGYRIELGEVESALREQKGVKEAVVIAREDEVGGGRQLVGYVVMERRGEMEGGEIRRGMRRRLPEPMVPWMYVELEQIPLTVNGKVDRRALPAPGSSSGERESVHVEPRTLAEEVLREIWADVLREQQVGIDDNFFMLGGDSILSIQVGARAQQQGLKLTHQDIFRHQTIRGLAAAISFSEAAAAAPPPTAPFCLISEEDKLKLDDDTRDAYPLSMLQAGMIFHSEYSSDLPVFHDIHSIHVRAPFKAEMMFKVLANQMAQHDVLRTSFEMSRFSTPLQIVHGSVEVPFSITDISLLSAEEQEKALADWTEQDKDRHFNWTEAPLLRFHIHRRAEDAFQFTLSFHHAILDGWSSATLLTDTFRDYLMMLRNEWRAGEPLASSYRDFIALEQAALKSAEAKQFWIESLSDSTINTLPVRSSTGDEASALSKVRVIDVPIPVDISEALKKLAGSLSVPVKSVLLAAHCRVISLLSGKPDVMTGYTSHGRPEQTDGERVLGLFLNALPMRLKMPGGTWAELAQQTFEAERETLPYRWYPMAQIKNNHGSEELFETCFTFLHYHVYQKVRQIENIDNVDILGWESFEQTTFTLLANFHMDVSTAQVRLALSFDAAKLSGEQMDAICHYYAEALAAIALDSGGRYEYANLLSVEEEKQLQAWNNGRQSFPANLSMQGIFEAQAAKSPEAVALTFEDEQLTYGQLNERANRIAHRLRSLGVGPEVLVGICAEPGFALIAGLLGILKSGGAYVPLDSSYPQQRLAFIMEDAQVSILLTEERLLASLPGHAAEVILLDSFIEEPAQNDLENPLNVTNPDNVAYVIYTSGSTGQPKGVPVTHANVQRLFAATADWFEFDGTDVWTLFHSYAFDFSVWEIWGALFHGARLVLVPYWVTRTPAAFHELLINEHVTVLNQTPSAFRQLLKADEAGASRDRLALRYIVFGGEALDAQSVKEWFALHGDSQPRLVNMYGITETTVHVTYRPLSLSDLNDTQASPVGIPIPDLGVYLLDEKLNPVPPGVVGELYVGGAGLARGYLRRSELTAERFIPNPFAEAPGERLYKSGDRARFLPDGNLVYAGRIDEQVKLRGFRIELNEIETTLRQHASIADAIVVLREDAPGEQRLVAYFVPNVESAASVGELRDYLKETLPLPMIPANFVELEALPLTAHGKVNRRLLPAPEASAASASDAFIAPRTPTEEVLAGIWSQVLGVSLVSASDSFFDLGGHSLLATQLISSVRQTFRIELPIRAIFESPKLSAQAAKIDEARLAGLSEESVPLVPVSRDESLPLSFAQQRLWFLHQLDVDSPAYNIPLAVRLKGSLDPTALEQTLTEITRRHEVLRTTFRVVNGQPTQFIAAAEECPIKRLELEDLPEGERDKQAHLLAETEGRAPFDLTKGPLFRVSLLRLAGDEHIVLFTMHHIIADGWSMGLLVNEVAELYRTFVGTETPALPELPIQYADFAYWQRQRFQGELLETQLSYWTQQLANAPTLLLPLDRPRPANPTHRRATHEWTLNAACSEQLPRLAREEGATSFMVLLAFFQILLHHYSRQESIVVGTDVANRNRAETENLIGFFVNQLVLRTDVSGNPTFRELLSRVRRVTLDAYTHQDVPFEKLVETLNPDRSTGLTPLFQVKLILQNTPMQELQLPGLTLTPVPSDIGKAKFDLLFNLIETEQALIGFMEYDLDIFDGPTISRMMEHFETLIRTVLSQPEVRLDELIATLDRIDKQRGIEREEELEELRLQKLKNIGRKPARALRLV